jgi:ribosome maturation factor RimP
VVDPIIEDLELELVDLVYGGGRLKITIDHPDGLGTELLTKATRLISHELDLNDPVNGTYTLEVTSPGVERDLRTVAHYERSVGETVSLKLKPNDDKLRRLKGELSAVTESDVTVIQDGESHTISYDLIAKAKTVFDWGPAPKPGSPKKSSKNSAKKGSDS